MKARENAPNGSSVELTLDPGDSFGSFKWPADSVGVTRIVIMTAVNPVSPPDIQASQQADLDAFAALKDGGLKVERWVDQGLPPSFSVSSAQAMIQLSRMPYAGPISDTAKTIAQAVEALVEKSGDYELQTWFARAQRWVISNPNVKKIAKAFSLTDQEVLAAFQAASKIEE